MMCASKWVFICAGLSKLKRSFAGFAAGAASASPAASDSSRSIIVLQTDTQESQMCTLAGPAIILRTSFCALPQNEQNVMRVDLAI